MRPLTYIMVVEAAADLADGPYSFAMFDQNPWPPVGDADENAFRLNDDACAVLLGVL